jgi:pyridoxine 4-dehydrogenase
MPELRFSLGGDLDICRMGFGAMRICGKGAWGWPKDRGRVHKVLQAAREGGIDFIDTSDAYGPETSEYLLEASLRPYGSLVIATKGGLVRGGPRDWTPDGRPAHLRRALENSLRRLGTESIALYQLHAIDDAVPLEDSLGALVDLQNEGKIRHIGVSNFSVDELARAQNVANIVSVQNRFNLLDRTHEPVLNACEASGIAFIPWYPLATGDLTRTPALEQIAKKHRAKPGQIALSWLLHRSPVMLPIPGTHSVAHLEQNIASQKISLDKDDMTALGGMA